MSIRQLAQSALQREIYTTHMYQSRPKHIFPFKGLWVCGDRHYEGAQACHVSFKRPLGFEEKIIMFFLLVYQYLLYLWWVCVLFVCRYMLYFWWVCILSVYQYMLYFWWVCVLFVYQDMFNFRWVCVLFLDQYLLYFWWVCGGLLGV